MAIRPHPRRVVSLKLLLIVAADAEGYRGLVNVLRSGATSHLLTLNAPFLLCTDKDIISKQLSITTGRILNFYGEYDNGDKLSHFFAYLARMKFIQRWGLMRNVRQENIQEHSLQAAMIAHNLALVRNKWFGGNVDP